MKKPLKSGAQMLLLPMLALLLQAQAQINVEVEDPNPTTKELSDAAAASATSTRLATDDDADHDNVPAGPVYVNDVVDASSDGDEFVPPTPKSGAPDPEQDARRELDEPETEPVFAEEKPRQQDARRELEPAAGYSTLPVELQEAQQDAIMREELRPEDAAADTTRRHVPDITDPDQSSDIAPREKPALDPIWDEFMTNQELEDRHGDQSLRRREAAPQWFDRHTLYGSPCSYLKCTVERDVVTARRRVTSNKCRVDSYKRPRSWNKKDWTGFDKQCCQTKKFAEDSRYYRITGDSCNSKKWCCKGSCMKWKKCKWYEEWWCTSGWAKTKSSGRCKTKETYKNGRRLEAGEEDVFQRTEENPTSEA